MQRYAILAFVLIAGALLASTMTGGGGTWEAIKPLLVPVATVFVNTFNSPATAFALCLMMVIVAAGLYAYYTFGRTAPARRDLDLLRSELEAINAPAGSEAALTQIERAMQRHPRFQKSWRLFAATLVPGPDGVTRSQFPPSRYFNMRMLENEGMRIRFFLGLPNDFVGLGLVFTFLGLVAGLYFASRSMMSEDLAVARSALTQLLHAATFKFLTSIVGISISLVMSAAQRLMLERLQSTLDDIQFLIEAKLPPVLSAAGWRSAPQPDRQAAE